MKGLFLVFALTAMSNATAAGFHYDHLEAARFQGEFGGLEFDGIELHGSKAFGAWRVFGSYETYDLDRLEIAGLFAFEAGSDAFRIGGGHAWSVHERIDIVSGAGLVRESVHTDLIDPANGDDISIVPDMTDNGYFVVLGFRARILQRLEGEYRHRFTNVLKNRANDWRVDIRYAFTPALSAGVGHRDFEGDTAASFGLRWTF